jgi:uncharacterized membrane protein
MSESPPQPAKPEFLELSASRSFRSQLQRELPRWIARGIIPESAATQLSEHYRLGEINRDIGRLFSLTIMIIAGLLIGGGIITFVAAHWESIPSAVKIAGGVALLIGSYAAGWRMIATPKRERLGHALLFLGTLIFGADIGLFAQVFNIHSEWYRGFGAWAIGAFAIAWAAQSISAGIVALVISFAWAMGAGEDKQAIAFAYPLVMPLLLMPLAILQKSESFFRLVTYATILSCLILSGFASQGYAVIISGAIVSALFIGIGEARFRDARLKPYAVHAGDAGALCVAANAYVYSFHWHFREFHFWSDFGKATQWTWAAVMSIALIGAIVLLARAFRGRRFTKEERQDWGLLFIPVGLMTLVGIASLPGIAYWTMDFQVPWVVLMNIAALALGMGALLRALRKENRKLFWAGTAYIVLIILSRFFEYDTNLIVKAMAFLICGILVLVAGIEYERHLRRKEAVHA